MQVLIIEKLQQRREGHAIEDRKRQDDLRDQDSLRWALPAAGRNGGCGDRDQQLGHVKVAAEQRRERPRRRRERELSPTPVLKMLEVLRVEVEVRHPAVRPPEAAEHDDETRGTGGRPNRQRNVMEGRQDSAHLSRIVRSLNVLGSSWVQLSPLPSLPDLPTT